MRWLKHVMDQPSQFISIQGGLLVECAVKSLKADPGLKVKMLMKKKTIKVSEGAQRVS